MALARAHSEKYLAVYMYRYPRLMVVLCRGDLQVALDLYRKAESYVPDNIKLKERWILFVVHVFLERTSHSKDTR